MSHHVYTLDMNRVNSVYRLVIIIIMIMIIKNNLYSKKVTQFNGKDLS